MVKTKSFQELLITNMNIHLKQLNDELVFHHKISNSILKSNTQILTELKNTKKSCAIVNEHAIGRERRDKKLLYRIVVGLLVTLLAFALGEKYKIFGFSGLG